MPTETPSQAEAMEVATVTITKSSDVKVAMGSSTSGLPTVAKLAHVLAAFVATLITLAVGIVLADGTSVIKLQQERFLPTITNPKLFKSHGLKYNAAELLGPTYGIGLHHDQAGFTWTKTGAESTLSYLIDQLGLPVVIAAVPRVIATDSLKNPVEFLSCHDLKAACLSAMSLGFIAEVAACLMVLFHCLVLTGLMPPKYVKPLGALVWFVLTAGFLVVILLAIGIYTARWSCSQEIVPSIKLSEHFEYNYGFYFAIIGFVSSLLVFTTTLFFTSMNDGAGAQSVAVKPAAIKSVVSIGTGVVTCVALSLIVLSSVTGWESDNNPRVDATKNYCEKQKPYHAGPGDNYFSNTQCEKDSITQTLEQAGANVTRGFKGLLDAGDRVPITKQYKDTDLCPVNVHWHLGAEHLSVGQFDEHGKGPADHHEDADHAGRSLASDARRGFRCHHYDANDPKFTTPFDWKFCTSMHVGETYEIHWPHSAAGACGTKWQYQTPFYDGVFCNDGIITVTPLNTYEKIGVQGQIFTIVNDDDPSYYYADLFKGMRTDGEFGQDMAMYTGSTTGTSRNNEVCSRYTPITWQVDRKCHMISASSFDKMCQDMLANADDMSGDVHPHGSREVSSPAFVANNQQSRK